MHMTTGQGRSRKAPQCPNESPYHFLVSEGGGVSPEVAKPVPLHLGQTTNPFRLLLAQALHVPMTTQDSLRASPVPLHSGHATSRFPAQRGHCSLTSPTGIPPSCPVQSSTDNGCAQSAVSADRLYVIPAACTTPLPSPSVPPMARPRPAHRHDRLYDWDDHLTARTRMKSRAPFRRIMAPAGLKIFPSKLANRS